VLFRSRTGRPVGTSGAPGNYTNLRLSPDGRRIAADQTEVGGRNNDIWIHDTARDTRTRLTFSPTFTSTPIWSPDASQILFSANRKLGFDLLLRKADGSGAEETVESFGGIQANAWDWSRDGRYVLVRKGNELWWLTWTERLSKPLMQGKWTVRNAQFSPDGRWIAYASNETGSMEIYVSAFPSGNGKWQASNGGGQEPRWRQDGKELFYLSADGKMMSVEVTPGTVFKAGPPVVLFQTHLRQALSSQDLFSYDVSGNGQKFVTLTNVDKSDAAPLSITLNWASEMEK
jgi:Tol biopolymer transport system component